MRNYFVALLVILGLCLAIPAQAQSRRRGHRDDSRSYSRDHNYRDSRRGYGSYRNDDPLAALRHQGNRVRYGMAGLSYDANRSICERHLARYGWDRVAESRCRFAQGDAREMHRLDRDSRRYGRYRGYRDDYIDIDTILNGADTFGSIWGAIEAHRANNKLEELKEQEARTQELLAEWAEQEPSPETATKEGVHVKIPQIWINTTGHQLCLKDRDDREPTCLANGQAASIGDATPDPNFGTACEVMDDSCTCDFKHKSSNIYYVICGK